MSENTPDGPSQASQVSPDAARNQLAKRESLGHELVSGETVRESELLPPMLAGHATPALAERTQTFCMSVASMFDAWVQRTKNLNTQRTYRRGVLNFIEYLGIDWPDNSREFLQATVPDVQAWRDAMELEGQAPATLNARITAVSRFYGFMREAATEMRLPIQVPNPAHAQFIKRESADPVSPTAALTRGTAHKLMGLPTGDDVLAARDRAIIATFLYTGARIGSVCRLTVTDFHDAPDDPTLKIGEKGRSKSKRRIGVHIHCAEAIREYLEVAGIEKGPLYRARLNPRSKKLAERAISQPSMYRLLLGYLESLPKAMITEDVIDENGEPVLGEDGSPTTVKRCRYSPHSLRATTATLLDEAGVPIKRIQELLGHKDIRVTQTYIKLLRDTRKSASHDVPL